MDARPASATQLAEVEVTQVLVKQVGRQVVGHVKVDQAVVIKVGGQDGQATTLPIDDSRRVGHIDEPAMIVAVDMVG